MPNATPSHSKPAVEPSVAGTAGGEHAHAHHHDDASPLSPAAVEAALELADAYCSERGERLTPIRRKVFGLLLASNRATKAYTLLDEMRKVHAGSAPPTVYRALDFLLEMGLVHKIESINAFAACHDVTHCRHGLLVVCQHCGKIAEFHDDAIERALAESIARVGYAIAGDAAEIKGVCAACQARAAANGEAPTR
ncbi:Fur family transcriptional regulator [Chitinasiproducens palmae]|uniref:Fur family transcriptional regulator, zinc uptake regulator n=1 Tax=Chitinasiproducens palmae TaxID=1770053 RepID=A0A1H2PKX7_9BURK|nr:Fur family transcriptional regulator [Chitinasiproducens palmae]SDV46249.1 Fur family transcriptional regulator, zinc uptake regulator [Chitinasiproducens palmae]